MYIARFSYDFLPADRDRAMELIRKELHDAHEAGLNARILIPFTRAPGCASMQFEIELNSLNELERFRNRESGNSIGDKSDWMHAFSEILKTPPSVEILHIAE